MRPLLVALLAAVATVASSAAAPALADKWDPRKEQSRARGDLGRAEAAAEAFLAANPSLDVYFDEAYGYAILPTITKGAIGIGGARGQGIVYAQGKPTHQVFMTQVTVGLQLGGRRYSELIFFRDADAYQAFIDGEFELSANANAIVATDGASATNSYHDGLAIFLLDKVGAMFDASVGGQSFNVRPLPEAPATTAKNARVPWEDGIR